MGIVITYKSYNYIVMIYIILIIFNFNYLYSFLLELYWVATYVATHPLYFVLSLLIHEQLSK